VAGIPLTRKVGIVARVAAQQVRRSRTVVALVSAGRATASSVGKVLHQLWLEVTGFVFLFMACIGGIAFSREYAKYEAGRTGPGRVIIAICFCLTFAYFGLSSFWRVRRKKQN
jgi:hypothetical protein